MMLSAQVRAACGVLVLSDEVLNELMRRLAADIDKGLRRESHEQAVVKCYVTYLQDLPSGKEQGEFLALDLGGTHFRVLLIHLGENHFEMQSKIYDIPRATMRGTGVQLFDHIAECLANFMKEQGVQNRKFALGFTFSFPLQQLGLTKGLLQAWTKGFNCSGVVGKDVVQFLRDAIKRRGDIQIEVCAILNDTTGTLMSCAWKNRSCRIGLIIGTGCNVCYVEKTENCEMFDGDRTKPDCIVNTEWGAFGGDGSLDIVTTEYDRTLDTHSLNRGKQVFEKMISGMYLGELVRILMVKFTENKLLFGGKGSDFLFTPDKFSTKHVSKIESDDGGSFFKCREVLIELDLPHATEQDCANVRYICECVSRRSAHLVSAGIAVLINKMNIPNITVGVDGSVYRFHPHFHGLMVAKINQLILPGIKFDLMLSEDGSGRGAALVAAVACRTVMQKVH